MADVKLQALDEEDLLVLSAHCQDAVIRVGDMVYQASPRRFALVCNRFDWASAATKTSWWRPKSYERRNAGLRFEHVTRVRTSGFDPKAADSVVTLLAITFEPEREVPPSGRVTLRFGGGGVVQLDVECIEAELRDLGGVWSTLRKPDHSAGAAPGEPTAGSPADETKS
jgi:hypothetical protein